MLLTTTAATLRTTISFWPKGCDDATHKILELLEAHTTGACHVANSDMASRFDNVSAVVATSSSSTRVVPADHGTFPRKADVPANEALTSAQLPAWGLIPLRRWDQALAEYLGSLQQPAET